MSFPRAATGRARVSGRAPMAFAVCDRDGQLHNRADLSWQYDYRGVGLQNLRILVCRDCMDRPQAQLRAYAPPADPVPVRDPRTDPNVGVNYQGFTFLNLGNPPATSGGGIGSFAIGISAIGGGGVSGYASTLFPIDKGSALASATAASGVATPPVITDNSIIISPVNTPTLLMAPNPQRSWLLIYSPVAAPTQISLGTATWGALSNLNLGPGVALFWSTTPSATVYQGAITANALTPGTPVWAWQASGQPMYDSDGNIMFDSDGNAMFSS